MAQKKPEPKQPLRRRLRLSGKLGALFNGQGVQVNREIQRVALEESRLKIPLIFGADVWHGMLGCLKFSKRKCLVQGISTKIHLQKRFDTSRLNITSIMASVHIYMITRSSYPYPFTPLFILLFFFIHTQSKLLISHCILLGCGPSSRHLWPKPPLGIPTWPIARHVPAQWRPLQVA